MTLGTAERQGDLLDDVTRFCDATLSESSVYAVLHRQRHRLFPDELFADLFSRRGRRSVPPSVVAVVMVLQRLEGLSDREAVERYAFDARWRYAAGVGGYDTGGWGRFAHTVLVDMRARLAASSDPRRIFAATVDAASQAGLVGARRVLDSTPLYDAVATMDTVTLVRSAIRGLLRAADDTLAGELRAALASGDEYASAAKPVIDWDDADARQALIDSRARDACACLAHLDGRELDGAVAEAAELLARVVGQDLEQTGDGVFGIIRGTATDRVISVVDPDARHGHKSSARGFDGYKGHVAVDPDSEIITDTAATAANAGDASVAADLIDDLTATHDAIARDDHDRDDDADAHDRVADGAAAASDRDGDGDGGGEPAVYGDAAYGAGEFLDHLDEAGIDARCKTQPPPGRRGRFSKDAFVVDLDDDTVTCPAGVTVGIRRGRRGDGQAAFGAACGDCRLRAQCTDAAGGRTVAVSRYERHLANARLRQQDPAWQADYRATRPKVERKIAHLVRRRHGGRRARVRGIGKVDADFNLLAAAVNVARLAVLGLRYHPTVGWTAAV